MDTSFSRHHRRAAGRIYPESRAQAEAQLLSRPRASRHPLQIYPLVRELAVDGIPVAVTCRVLKIARQPYYRWLANPVTTRDLARAHRANALFDAHRDDPEFGYRFLVDEAAAVGQPMATRTAWAICAANRWWSVFGKPLRGKGARPGPPVHDDRVNRVFAASAPNLLWLTDIERHEALLNRAVVEGHRGRSVAAGR